MYYEGINRFKTYINFYSNKEELLTVLKDLINNGFKTKYSDQERLGFLNENSWKVRLENMIKIFDENERGF